MPGVAAIQQQHSIIAALGPDCLDQCRGAVQSAKAAIGTGQGFVIDHGVRIGKRRPRLDPEMPKEILTDKMRRNAFEIANAEIL